MGFEQNYVARIVREGGGLTSNIRETNEVKLSRIRRSTVLIAAVLLLTAICAAQGDTEYTRPSLRGIQGLGVLIENLGSDVEAAGLHEADIQTDVELKLRLAGIKVITVPESYKQPGAPRLYVIAHVNLSNQQPIIYAISVQLQQGVVLERNSALSISATTWSSSPIVELFPFRDTQKIRDMIRDRVDQFINAYLSVNPKK